MYLNKAVLKKRNQNQSLYKGLQGPPRPGTPTHSLASPLTALPPLQLHWPPALTGLFQANPGPRASAVAVPSASDTLPPNIPQLFQGFSQKFPAH